MTYDRFSGDPLLTLSSGGVDVTYNNGQPVMDQGLLNQATLALFTRPGWSGNIYLPPASQMGSDFQDTCQGAITLSKVQQAIPNSASRALSSPYFPTIAVAVTNPTGDHITAVINLGPGKSLVLNRVRQKWVATAQGVL